MTFKNWQKRLVLIGISSVLFIIATLIILKVFNDSIVFFYDPSELKAKFESVKDREIRIGGIVQPGSVTFLEDRETIEFIITDFDNEVKIRFKGIIPSLFREGQGTIALGRLQSDGVFIAKELLAKHDENYMPKEVADSLKKSGKWRESQEVDENENQDQQHIQRPEEQMNKPPYNIFE